MQKVRLYFFLGHTVYGLCDVSIFERNKKHRPIFHPPWKVVVSVLEHGRIIYMNLYSSRGRGCPIIRLYYTALLPPPPPRLQKSLRDVCKCVWYVNCFFFFFFYFSILTRLDEWTWISQFRIDINKNWNVLTKLIPNKNEILNDVKLMIVNDQVPNKQIADVINKTFNEVVLRLQTPSGSTSEGELNSLQTLSLPASVYKLCNKGGICFKRNDKYWLFKSSGSRWHTS